MKTYLDVSYLHVNIITYVCNEQDFERYLLIVKRFHVKKPMARLYEQEVDALLSHEPFYAIKIFIIIRV